jgi:hypothetical protein
MAPRYSKLYFEKAFNVTTNIFGVAFTGYEGRT